MATRRKGLAGLAGHAHYHGCRRCHVRYEDACDLVAEDDYCVQCRGGRRGELLTRNAAPVDCCRREARLASKDERMRYRLAGAGLWWICPSCFRTIPYDDPKVGHPGYEAVQASSPPR